jgi:hypothetical protein
VSGRALHTREQFSFVAHAPFDVAWPLFGADGEKAWAPGWDPDFLWPADAGDQEGMVFRIRHGLGVAVWINTSFDRQTGRIQYVYVIPEVVATVISLQLSSLGEATQVAVTYERTALSDEAVQQVSTLAEQDKAAGTEWSRQIDGCLRARR